MLAKKQNKKKKKIKTITTKSTHEVITQSLCTEIHESLSTLALCWCKDILHTQAAMVEAHGEHAMEIPRLSLL